MKIALLRTIILVIIAVTVTMQQWHFESSQPPNDFGFFWTTVQFMKIYDRTDIFTEQGEQAINAAQPQPSGAFYTVTQTPFLYSFVSAVSSGNFATDARRFHAICLASFVLAAILLFWLFGYGPDSSLAVYISIVLLFAPLAMDAQVASNNRIQLGLLALAAACIRFRSHFWHFAAGILFGLGVMFKPTTLFIPLLLLSSRAMRRQWRLMAVETAGCLAGILLGFAAGAMLFGTGSCWLDWATRIGRLPIDASPLDLLNFSLPVLLKEITGANFSTPVLVIGFSAAAWCIFRLTRTFQKNTASCCIDDSGRASLLFDLQVIATGSTVYLLCASLVWNHYYTFTLPLIILLLSPAWLRSQGVHMSAAAVLAASALAVHIVIVMSGMLLLAGWLSWSAACVLFLLGTARPYPSCTASHPEIA